ncbi:unnamed protein product [Malus baccata var. baccata]
MIREDIFFNGIDQSYCTWYWHGEAVPDSKNEKRIDGKLRHPADSPSWKLVDHMWLEFEGTVECGYYVMKYMKEIIDDPNCSIITKFKEKATYTQQEIDALRIERAEYVDDFIPIDETLD